MTDKRPLEGVCFVFKVVCFAQSFRQVVSIIVKTLRNTNLVA